MDIRTCLAKLKNPGSQTRVFTVCSEHFDTKQTVKKLSRIKKLAQGTLPAISNEHTVHNRPSQRERRLDERRK